MPASVVLPSSPPDRRDVLRPAAALTFAILGTAAAAVSVARLAQTLAAQRATGPTEQPEPPSLVWEG